MAATGRPSTDLVSQSRPPPTTRPSTGSGSRPSARGSNATDLGAAGSARVEGVGVREREGPSGGNRDPDRWSWGGHGHPIDREARRRLRQPGRGAEVDTFGDGDGQRGEGSLDARGFLGNRDETEVTVAPDEAVVPAERAENRYPDRCDRLSQHGLMAVGRDPVEHDGGQVNCRVEGREAVDDGGDRAGHGFGVDYQEHRCVQEAGDVRGGRGRAVRSAVEQAHDPLDHQHVGALRTSGEWSDGGGAAEPGVEVARRSAAGEGVVAGVDEVGAHLGGGGVVPGGPERGQEAGRHRGLADSRVGTGDDEPGSENRHDAGR
jgi:hypothetical protein